MAFPNNKPIQLLPLRQLDSKFDLDIRNVSKSKCFGMKSNHQVVKNVENFAIDFGRKSSIHGMNRVFQKKSNKYERLFWFLTVVLPLIGSIYFSLVLSQRYNAGSLQTVVDSTNKPIFEIPFPEVAICNANHLNWDRLEMAKQHFLPNENDTEKIRMFELVIGLYDNLAFGRFENYQALKGEPIELVNNINFSLVFDFMTWRCNELLTNCRWRHLKMNCCKIFSKVKGEGGICWHFNTLSDEEGKRKQLMDDKYPWRTGSVGPKSALNVRVMINKNKHFRHNNKKGIMVSIMEPNIWQITQNFIPANTQTMIEVEPVIHLYDNQTLILTSQQRQCLFNDEHNSYAFKSLKGFIYMKENCESQCHQEYLIKYCNCTMDLLFPPAEYKSCKVKDLLCLAHYNDYFRFSHRPGEEDYVHSDNRSIVCKCFRNCYSINYAWEAIPTLLPQYIRKNKTYVDLDVHFRFDAMTVYRTNLVIDRINLIVSYGGIAGLFLGCSLISVIELLYFALIALPLFIYTELKNRDKTLQKCINQQLQQQRQFNLIPSRHHNWDLNRTKTLQKFQNNDFSFHNNRSEQNNPKNKAMQLWSQEYYLP